jgi:hypothetical protein
LKETQQDGLPARRHRLHLVKEKGTTLTLRDDASMSIFGIREGTALVPEQLALNEVIRERSAIHRNEGAVAAGTQIVEGSGREFFAGPSLALNEHRRVDDRNFFNNIQRFQEERRIAQQIEPRESMSWHPVPRSRSTVCLRTHNQTPPCQEIVHL